MILNGKGGPPKDVPASQLWARLQEMPRPTRIVDFPRKNESGEPIGQVRIRILTQEEQIAAAASADTFARKLLKEASREHIGYDEVYRNAMCVEILFRACRDVDEPTRPAFPRPEQIREHMTAEECGVLFEHYMTVQTEVGPLASSLSKEECEAWIEKIAKGGSAFPFDLLSSELQKILVLFMASRLATSQTDTSSVGSPLDAPDEDQSEPEPEESAPAEV